MGKILRGSRFAVLALVLLYAGDDISARFRLPNGRQTLGSVDVQVMWAIKQKNGRIDYELGDRETRPCLYSLFPHLGYTPCWYLTRHKSQVIEVGNVRVEDKLKEPAGNRISTAMGCDCSKHNHRILWPTRAKRFIPTGT